MILALELESLRTDPLDEELSSCGNDDDDGRRTDIPDSSLLIGSVAGEGARWSPTSVAVARMVSADEPPLLSWPVHGRTGQGDAEERRRIGVAARFVISATASTPCPSRPKSSDTTERQSHHSSGRDSRTSTTTRQEFSTSSSSSSSSSSSGSGGSLPEGYSRVARSLQLAHTSELDEQRLVLNCHQLDDSPFYVGELSSTDAKRCLRRCPPGTFLVRDSGHPHHLYSLTVRTQRGVTSIRTVYTTDGFRLDSDPEQAELMPSFDSVVALVSHYVDESRTTAHGGGRQRSSCVFVDRDGRRDLPVVLTTPYRSRPASLRHLCRLMINVAVNGRDTDRLCLVPSLREFLKRHPFRV